MFSQKAAAVMFPTPGEAIVDWLRSVPISGRAGYVSDVLLKGLHKHCETR